MIRLPINRQFRKKNRLRKLSEHYLIPEMGDNRKVKQQIPHNAWFPQKVANNITIELLTKGLIRALVSSFLSNPMKN